MRRLLPVLLLALALPLPARADLLTALAGGGRHGLVEVQRGVWIDRSAGAAARKTVLENIGKARGRMTKLFGAHGTAPEWRVCTTAACDRANGLTGKGRSWADLVITISSDAAPLLSTYTHEATHVVMSKALGDRTGNPARLPAWFDEGFAVLVSQSVGYPESPATCDPVRGKPLPRTQEEFKALSAPNGANPIYHRAACAVRDALGDRAFRRAREVLLAGGALPGGLR